MNLSPLLTLMNQNYLRTWSKELSVPVLSVDYSLSPEAPYPRALEECFYAYCWALKNCRLLGMFMKSHSDNKDFRKLFYHSNCLGEQNCLFFFLHNK